MKKSNENPVVSPVSIYGEKNIIVALQPKRLPSVAPGLEGLAALAVDSGDASDTSLDHSVISDVTDAGLVDDLGFSNDGGESGFVPEVVSCEVGSNPWGEMATSYPVGVQPIPELGLGGEAVNQEGGQIESHTQDGLETDQTIAEAEEGLHLLGQEQLFNPTDSIDPEFFLVNIFDGQEEFGEDPYGIEGDPVNIEDYLEICVLPSFETDKLDRYDDGLGDYGFVDQGGEHVYYENLDYSKELLSEYYAYLEANPPFELGDPESEELVAQVITSSGYFPNLEFSDSLKANSFDKWYEQTYLAGFEGNFEGGFEGDADPLYTLTRDFDLGAVPAEEISYSSLGQSGQIDEVTQAEAVGGVSVEVTSVDEGLLPSTQPADFKTPLVVLPSLVSVAIDFSNSLEVPSSDLNFEGGQVVGVNLGVNSLDALPLELSIQDFQEAMPSESASNEPLGSLSGNLLYQGGSQFETLELPALSSEEALDTQVFVQSTPLGQDSLEYVPLQVDQINSSSNEFVFKSQHALAGAATAVALGVDSRRRKVSD